MAIKTVSVPDIGGAQGAEVIEVSIAVGDLLEEEQTIVVLETDKASMDVPSPVAGKVTAVTVNVGDKVAEGDPLFDYEAEANADAPTEAAPESTSAPVSTVAPAETATSAEDTKAAGGSGSAEGSDTTQEVVTVPEGAEGADIIEISVAVGDEVAEGDTLIVLETDKASMEVPSPAAGKVVSIAARQGEKTGAGDPILTLAVVGSAPAIATATPAPVTSSAPAMPVSKPAAPTQPVDEAAIVSASQSKDIYAGPAARKLAREMAVDLNQVSGTGDRARVTKDDIKAYVKQVMTRQAALPSATGGGMATGAYMPAMPAVDFAQFGEIDLQPMSKIKKLTAANMVRNWSLIPHVTQFDDADITDLEAFRQSLKPEAEKRGVKLTPVPFLLKACAAALIAEPAFNVSLHHDGEQLVWKKYVHIGVAVDSPVGLVVPVIRDVDKKGLWELAAEFLAITGKARDGKLTPKEMQGGCFTVSSLGAIGGQGFTPIINAPEVAILGVSKAEIKPVWNGSEFVPRNRLPLSLSYDHRAVNGADAGRFFTYLNSVIADVRRLLL